MTGPAQPGNGGVGVGEPAALQTAVEGYLAALSAHQLEKCVSFYADDATINFQSGIFQGREAITEWHKERFAASFEVLDVDRLTVTGDTVVVEAAITSARLRAWKVKRLSGKATLVFEHGRIKEARLAPRTYNPFEGW